jgi:holo-[acyl-carrier protein] synthase
MILGIGVDMVSVTRIKEKIQRNAAFKEYVFSENEITYCEKKANPSESYAVRFAAKEAFLKAIGSGLLVDFELKHIEVSTNEDGVPSFLFSSEVKKNMITRWGKEPKVALSLSHELDNGIAFVIIESE